MEKRGWQMEETTLIYMPTKEEKEKIDFVCRKIADDLFCLNVEQKAFALAALVNSFQDITHYNLRNAIYDIKSLKNTQNQPKNEENRYKSEQK